MPTFGDSSGQCSLAMINMANSSNIYVGFGSHIGSKSIIKESIQ